MALLPLPAQCTVLYLPSLSGGLGDRDLAWVFCLQAKKEAS